MYDPSLGRWITEDPTGFEGGDNNLYGFVGENPVNGVDPSGLQDRKGPNYDRNGNYIGAGREPQPAPVPEKLRPITPAPPAPAPPRLSSDMRNWHPQGGIPS